MSGSTINGDYVLLDIDVLVEHPENVRRGDLGAISESITENGFYGAVLVQRSTNRIIAGNHRYRALKELGERTIPVIFIDVDDDRARRIMLADNRANDLAENDQAALVELLDKIQSETGSLVGTAYDADAYQQCVAALKKHGLAGADVTSPSLDDSAELQMKWQTERGQVWLCGKHRVMCGDSTSEADVGALLDGASPYLMVTDPPYGVNYNPGWRAEAAESGALCYRPTRVGKVVADDRADWSDAWGLFRANVAYVWHGAVQTVPVYDSMVRSGFEIRAQIIWSKPHFPIGRGAYTWRHEPCCYAVRKGQKSNWIGDAKESTIWEIALDKNVDGGHSTQKPIECMARPIRNHLGDVCDPFLGSGTTLIAAAELGRQCYGMEIDPGYLAVCLERYHKTCGELPIRL